MNYNEINQFTVLALYFLPFKMENQFALFTNLQVLKFYPIISMFNDISRL